MLGNLVNFSETIHLCTPLWKYEVIIYAEISASLLLVVRGCCLSWVSQCPFPPMSIHVSCQYLVCYWTEQMAAPGLPHVCLPLSRWLWALLAPRNNLIISCHTAIWTQQTWERNKWFTPLPPSYTLMEEDMLPSGAVCWKAKLQMHLKPTAKWEQLSFQERVHTGCKAFCYTLVFLFRPIKPCFMWAHEQYWDLYMHK